MLKYFIIVTETLVTTGILTGFIFAYIGGRYQTYGRRAVSLGALIGLLAAVVMAFLKNKTKLIDTGWWNIRNFLISTLFFLLFLLLDAKWMQGKKAQRAVPVIIAVQLGLLLFYALPDVIAYPYTFVLGGEVVLSTGFLFRLIGLLLGLVLVLVAGIAVYQCGVRVGTQLSGRLLKLALFVNAILQISKVIQLLLPQTRVNGAVLSLLHTMITKGRLISRHTYFEFAKFTSNHSALFIYATLGIALVAVGVLLIRSLHVDEPYENPAQHRKIRAKWRSVRRWCRTEAVCFVLAVLLMTTIKAYANREVELSPVEDAIVRDGSVYVSFEQVADGHLHRFGYVTEEGTQIRFIVIQKPNSSAYGIGLDACEICGETGYYEKDGQVVCKLCDVVMNINTIGFKGGCNPIVIPYSIEGGNIVVPIAGLLEYESEFK